MQFASDDTWLNGSLMRQLKGLLARSRGVETGELSQPKVTTAR